MEKNDLSSELDKAAEWNDSFSMQMQRPAINLVQGLTMNAQLLQSIKLMELPIVDLRERIEEEIEKNPALEITEDRSTVSIDDTAKHRKEEFDYFEATSDSGFVSRGGEEAADEQHRFIEGSLSRSETLQEHLLWQLRLAPVDAEIRRIGERIVQNLNEDGFHKEPLDLLLKTENPKKISRALKLVQSLDPQGCAVCNYQESLRVQIGLLPDQPEGIIEALDHLEILERGKIAEAAKILNRTEDEVKNIFERIKDLSPFPGRGFSSADTRYVVPDVRVIKKDEEFDIIINEEEIPVLGINPFFMKISGTKDSRETRDFARENIREARWFIQSINDRNHTLLKVTRAIVVFQRDFFVNGPRHIAPLTQRDIARELGLNESTISRTANGKYVETEWGIFELRHFFTNSISGVGSGGSKHSKAGVMELIREMVQGEGKGFSDQELADLLARRGIPLARRTVAKYRKELDLGSSYTR
ncbi:RNA polymerase factor sigma-54 [Leadbettera azotonutricia]|nr:RNA polymerase factor sigma-54 [Leadbettera azotonutricia]